MDRGLTDQILGDLHIASTLIRQRDFHTMAIPAQSEGESLGILSSIFVRSLTP